MKRRSHAEAFSLFSFQDIITSVTGVIILLTLFLALQVVQPRGAGVATMQTAHDEDLKQSIKQTDEQIKQLKQALSTGQQFLADFASLSPASLQEEEMQLTGAIDRLKSEIRQLESDIASAQLGEEELVAASDSSTKETLTALRNKVESLRQQLKALKSTNRVVYNVAPNANRTPWLVDLTTDSIRVSRPGSGNSRLEFQDGAERSGMQEFLAWASNRDATSDYFVLLVRPGALVKYRQSYEHLDKLGFAIGVDLLERNATLVNLSDLVAPNQ